RMETAAATRTPFLISTPNLNFLANSHSDRAFLESLPASDLSLVDGVSIFSVARLVGVPIKERAAGADLVDALRVDATRRISVFLFGGNEGAAAAACRALNLNGARCVGWLYPGFGSVEEMSSDNFIKCINESSADFLIVSLGALKGQSWLLRNHQ